MLNSVWLCYFFKGETLDFILTASKSQGIFDMTISSEGHCKDSNLSHTLKMYYNSTLNDIISDMKNPNKLVSFLYIIIKIIVYKIN